MRYLIARLRCGLFTTAEIARRIGRRSGTLRYASTVQRRTERKVRRLAALMLAEP